MTELQRMYAELRDLGYGWADAHERLAADLGLDRQTVARTLQRARLTDEREQKPTRPRRPGR